MSRASHEPHEHIPGQENEQVPSPRWAGHEAPPHGAHTHEADRARPGEAEPTAPHEDETDHGTPGRRLPALAALVFFTLACVVGLALLAVNMFGAVRAYAGPALGALVLGVITYTIGFLVLRRIRPVRPPRLALSFLATAWGLLAATGVGAYANSGMGGLWGQLLGYQAAGAWSAALSAPLNEEILKLAGVVVLAVAFPRALRGPVDGFVYGSLVGLGFEVTENFLYALNSITQSGALAPGVSVTDTSIVRVVLTGLGSHWAMSAIAGTAVGLLVAVGWRPGARRAVGALALVLLAMLGHFLFDSPFLGEGLFGIVVRVAFVFISAMAVYFSVRHAFRRRVKHALADQGQELGMRRSDARALASRHGRHRALGRVARPERPQVRERQEEMVEEAEERAARYARA